MERRHILRRRPIGEMHLASRCDIFSRSYSTCWTRPFYCYLLLFWSSFCSFWNTCRQVFFALFQLLNDHFGPSFCLYAILRFPSFQSECTIIITDLFGPPYCLIQSFDFRHELSWMPIFLVHPTALCHPQISILSYMNYHACTPTRLIESDRVAVSLLQLQ